MNDWWQSLEQRERWFVSGLGIFLGVFLAYLLLLEPLLLGASDYRDKVTRARQDLAWMQANEAAVTEIAQVPGGGGAQSSLNRVVDTTLQANQLRSERTNATGNNGMRVRLEDMPFDQIVAWLGTLQSQYSVAVVSASLDKAETPGTADASVELRRQ